MKIKHLIHTLIAVLFIWNIYTACLVREKTTSNNTILTDKEDQALEMILQERRKELLFKGLRWTDLRRLNQEPAHAKTLVSY